MEYRPLGTSDLKVSVIGFGAWGIGGPPFWKTEGDDASHAAILKAVDLGINFFDTAPVYGFGHSETLLGKALKPVRDKVLLATKCGLVWEKEALGSIAKVATRDSIFKEIEQSLRRLQTDYIDLYQVHWPDASTPQTETMEALLKLRDQGKIRHIGVSNYSVNQMQACLEVGPLASLQPEYSLVQRSIEKEIVPFCQEQRIGLIPYSPLASGVLTGKYQENTKFKDWRGKGIIGEFTGEGYVRNVKRVERLRKLANRLQKTCAQMAINWVIHQPGVTTALVGVKNLQQMESNIHAVGWQMEPPVAEEVNAIFSPVEVS